MSRSSIKSAIALNQDTCHSFGAAYSIKNMMTMMLANPMMMQTNPGARIYNHDGQRGMIQHEKDSDSWEISLLVANKILVKVDGSGMKDQQATEAYLKAMDLAAVQNAFGD